MMWPFKKRIPGETSPARDPRRPNGPSSHEPPTGKSELDKTLEQMRSSRGC